MSERPKSRLVSAGPRAKRVKMGGASRLVSAGPRAKRVKLGGALLTRYNKGGQLRPRQSAQYPNSALFETRGGNILGDFVKDMIFDKAAPAKYLNKFVHFTNQLKGGSGFVNSGGAAHNPWVSHCKRFAKAHRISYGEALHAARPSYRGGRGAH